MKITLFILKGLLLGIAVAKPTVFLIRHGEKPASGNGLNTQGEQRAQCLRSVFGASSGYNIGHIMAQTPQTDGSQQRPYDTVKPLADDLGMTIDTSCQRDDAKCVAKIVKKYNSDGNILIAWEHKALTNIVEAMGNKNAPIYPSDSFNLIWTNPPPYSDISAITSENCAGLDGEK